MGTRTIAQVALLVIGLIVWGYGTRADDVRLRWIGIACFALAFLLRLFKKRDQPEPPEHPERPSG